MLADVAFRLRGDRGPSLGTVLSLGDALPGGPAASDGDLSGAYEAELGEITSQMGHIDETLPPTSTSPVSV